MSGEEEKGTRWEAWKRWRRQSGEEESPEQQREKWARWKSWGPRAQEEESSGELRRWNAWIKWSRVSSEEEREKLRAYLERIERTPVEIPPELREEIRGIVDREEKTRAEMMERIAERRFKPADKEDVVEAQYELIGFLTELGERVIGHLEEEHKARSGAKRRKVILTAVGWALAIIMPLVVWYLSR